jgi:ribosomal protein S18 acetylase RimI-like enzyme
VLISDPTRGRLIEDIERASGNAWPAAENVDLHGWCLRYGGARSRRLNSVQTLRFDEGADTDAAIVEASHWYAQRGQAACFRLTDVVEPADLDAMLAARGFALLTPTSIMVVAAAMVTATPSLGVALRAEVTPEVLEAMCDPQWPAAIRRERIALFARLAVPHQFALITVDGRPAAAGMCVHEGQWAGIFSMRTQPAFRRRGLARAVLLRLAAWARAAGAQRFYLQVEDDNAAALSLYRDVGFVRQYGYHYRERGSYPPRP